MDWENVRCLLHLARAGSLAGAARELRVTHTTVRRRVARLEATLGTRLVARGAGGLRITAAGRRIVERAERMEELALGIERGVAGEDQRLEGPLRVTSTESIAAGFVAAEVTRFRARHPGILVELTTDPRPLSLARREADLAIRLTRPVEPTSVALRAGKLAFAAYAARRPRASPELLVYDEGIAAAQTEWLMRCHPSGRVVLRSNSSAALAAAAAAGHGVAVLPCLVGDPAVGLRRVTEPSQAPAPDVWLAAHQDLRAVARLAALWEHLAAAFAASPALRRG